MAFKYSDLARMSEDQLKARLAELKRQIEALPSTGDDYDGLVGECNCIGGLLVPTHYID